MEVGFFFWPYDPALVDRMSAAADRYGYDMIGIADTPGNAMDPWVAAALAARTVARARIALCVTNLATRHPAVSAAAVASLDLIAEGRTVLGIGAGHSGTGNIGVGRSSLNEIEAGIRHIKELLSGAPSTYSDRTGHLPWVERASPVFLAGSGPKTLALAGGIADGVFANFGITAETLEQSAAEIAEGVSKAGRAPDEIETWQIACLDCNEDGGAARAKIGAILAFIAGGYVLGSGDLASRCVPAEYHDRLAELRRRYSTRPGEADARLVDELGLYDYLAGRFAIVGTPEECLAQMRTARAAGLRRVMFTVSVASDPARTVELFGERVLPVLRAEE